jgi:TolB-like protein/DNA-binding winged helix-turn-helix (wHTH) protein
VTLPVFEFGDFHLDCGRFELRHKGRTVKLERKPMELLILLVTRRGELVSRAEIIEHLWEPDVFVDTEHGINTAIRKIRVALRDDREQPLFVQTVTGKGYLFVGTVVSITPSQKEEAQPVSSAGISQQVSAVVGPGSLAASAVPPLDSPPQKFRYRVVAGLAEKNHLIWLSVIPILILLTVTLLVVRPQVSRGWGNNNLPSSPSSAIRSLAVLPLANLSGQPQQDYLAHGWTDELVTALVRDPTLRVIPIRSTSHNKTLDRPLPEIGGELGVDGLLVGSVARSGDTVRMTLQLIQSSTGKELWTETYDRNLNEPVSLPADAAHEIFRRLNRADLPVSPPRIVKPAAHDAYLRGNYLWFKRQPDKAAGYFTSAIKLQPDYALAWAGLARCYGGSAIMGLTNPQDALNRQEAATRKALSLDESLAEAHLNMAAAMLQRWNWPQAEQEIVRTIELDPGFAEAYHFRAIMLAALDRQSEALDAQKKSTDLDPFAHPGGLAYSYMLARQYDAAMKELRLDLEANPQDPILLGATLEIYRRDGMEKEAGKALEQILLASPDKTLAAKSQRIYQQGGYKALLRLQLSDAEAKSSTQYISPYRLALLHAQLGHGKEALAMLEEAYRQHAPPLLWVQTDPAFDFLHSDERYRSIIRQIGFPRQPS